MMKNKSIFTFLAFCMLTVNLLAQDSLQQAPPPPPPKVTVLDYNVRMDNQNGKEELIFQSSGLNGLATMSLNGEDQQLLFKDGEARYAMETDSKGQLLFVSSGGKQQLFHLSENQGGDYRIKNIPLWLSIVPPLLAILLALIFKEVIVSLFVGIWAGAFIASGMRFGYIFSSFLEVAEKYILKALNNGGHLSVIIFSLLIGGMVAIISRNGGMAGVVLSLSKYARSARSTQFITWLLGVAIFFDDYANTLIVGNTMRPVSDKFKISREKLAYIVDSTAAPVAAVAFITTWIGAELGYIEGGIALLDNFDNSLSPYSIFVSSLKYSFYPILTLAFILILIYTRRDYGSMLVAERRARTTGQVSPAASLSEDEPNMEDLTPVKGAPLKWRNAAIPVLGVILMTIFGLVETGMSSLYSSLVDSGVSVASQSWGDIWSAMGSTPDGSQQSFFMKLGVLIGKSDSYVALLWASITGVLLAIILTVSSKIMNLFDTMHTMTTGFKTMMPALIILTLAWSLAITTEELYTANYITFMLQDSVSPYLLPSIVFVLAALIAFSTGSSWSTMAILFPIAIPTTWAICQGQGVDAGVSMEILFNVIATVLAASVLGDHCSPISDTTILSSLASDCNHIDHVRTQMPYALTVGSVSLVAGTVATLLGGGWLISFLMIAISLAILYGIVIRFGKTIEHE